MTFLIFVSDNLITFDDILRVWLEDGTQIDTPFWDKIILDESGKIETMYATFSIAAVPERFWRDLAPKDI
ncbi:hypothetical protein [Vibrio sp. YIC-376]|uniref:hypothetical protein n=1 Tax=Vibrio sp. YIC-376 TaxID=3136162 RepID=UPI00402AB234